MSPLTHGDIFYEGKTTCFTFTFYLSFIVRTYSFVRWRCLFLSWICFVIGIRYDTFFAISSSFFFFHVISSRFSCVFCWYTYICIVVNVIIGFCYIRSWQFIGVRRRPIFWGPVFHEAFGVFIRKDSNLYDWSFDSRIFAVLTKKRKPVSLFCTCFFVSSQTRNTYDNETDY